jgi:hypothetical protein
MNLKELTVCLCAALMSGCTWQNAAPAKIKSSPLAATTIENAKPQDDRAPFFGKWEPQQLAADGGVVGVWELNEDGNGARFRPSVYVQRGKEDYPCSERENIQWSVKDDILSIDSHGFRRRYRAVLDGLDKIELLPMKDDGPFHAMMTAVFLKRLTKGRENQWDAKYPERQKLQQLKSL